MWKATEADLFKMSCILRQMYIWHITKEQSIQVTSTARASSEFKLFIQSSYAFLNLVINAQHFYNRYETHLSILNWSIRPKCDIDQEN